MEKAARILRIAGWVLIVGQLVFFAAALMSPTATLPGPLEAVYDALVELFGGYRNEGALKLWGTIFFGGVGMVVLSRVLRNRTKT